MLPCLPICLWSDPPSQRGGMRASRQASAAQVHPPTWVSSVSRHGAEGYLAHGKVKRPSNGTPKPAPGSARSRIVPKAARWRNGGRTADGPPGAWEAFHTTQAHIDCSVRGNILWHASMRSAGTLIRINRAPVLTLWAVVAEWLRDPSDRAFSLASHVAGVAAREGTAPRHRRCCLTSRTCITSVGVQAFANPCAGCEWLHRRIRGGMSPRPRP